MGKERVILHSDLNNFFASVESVLNPELIGKPIAVCGSESDRHGIVLAKSEEAKQCGIKTTMTIREAKQLCPSLIIIPSRHGVYEEYSKKVRKIYERYTDKIEFFGIDEAWLDVTDFSLIGDGKTIADKIREDVKNELGLTCSVGVSFNKIFAKLASDMKKPDATTVITRENYVKKVWRLPVGDLLYVGKATQKLLMEINIRTIGDLATANQEFVADKLGKFGEDLWLYANGLDQSTVKGVDEYKDTKSVGNSITTYRDLKNIEDVKSVLSYLCESVSERVIRNGLGKATTISISIRDENLHWISRQQKLGRPSELSFDYYENSIDLFVKSYDWKTNIHSIGVSVSDFVKNSEQTQINNNENDYGKKLELEKRVYSLREKYGSESLKKGFSLKGEGRLLLDEKEETDRAKVGKEYLSTHKNKPKE